MGWATVTHPFHPLRGKRFAILKKRRLRGQELLSLFEETSGSFCLPREWTDQALYPPYAGLIQPAPILDVQCLVQLRLLAQNLKKEVEHAP